MGYRPCGLSTNITDRKDVNQDIQSMSFRQQVINNNAAIVAHTHEKFIQAFKTT